MILNACVKNETLIDETVCKNCNDKNCSHAGELTTKELIDLFKEFDPDYLTTD